MLTCSSRICQSCHNRLTSMGEDYHTRGSAGPNNICSSSLVQHKPRRRQHANHKLPRERDHYHLGECKSQSVEIKPAGWSNSQRKPTRRGDGTEGVPPCRPWQNLVPLRELRGGAERCPRPQDRVPRKAARRDHTHHAGIPGKARGESPPAAKRGGQHQRRSRRKSSRT